MRLCRGDQPQHVFQSGKLTNCHALRLVFDTAALRTQFLREFSKHIRVWPVNNKRLAYRTFIDIMTVIADAITMPPPVAAMPLPAERALRKLGRDLALARRKRGIATGDMAARLFVSRDTLWRLERGDPTVAIGTLVTATFILNLHDRLANLAAPASDELGLGLDERRLPKRIRRAKPGRIRALPRLPLPVGRGEGWGEGILAGQPRASSPAIAAVAAPPSDGREGENRGSARLRRAKP